MRPRILLLAVTAILALGVTGCAAFKSHPPPPLPAPSSELTVDHFWGTPLSGAHTAAASATMPPMNSALHLQMIWIGLAEMPTELPPPLGPSARLILASRNNHPVQPTPLLTLSTHFAQGPDAASRFEAFQKLTPQQQVTVGQMDDLLIAGATSDYLLSDTGDATAPAARRVELNISRPAMSKAPNKESAPIDLALAITESATGPDAQKQQGAMQRRELVLFSAPQGPLPRQALLILPLHFAKSQCKALAMYLIIDAADNSPQTTQQYTAVTSALASSAQQAAALTPASFAAAAQQSNVTSALSAMSSAAQQRRAIVYLAGQFNAPLCRDVAMVADDATLANLSDRIVKSASGVDTTKPGVLGSILDIAAMQLLAQGQADEKLPDVLIGVLLEHAGEAGRHSTSLEQVCKNISNQKEMQTRLIAENVIYLEDSSSASRVRAYDWLAAQGQAPAGYDPLGPARQRRDALDKALAATHPGN